MAIKQGYVFEDEIRRSIEQLAIEGKIDGTQLFCWKIVDTHSFSKLSSLTSGLKQFIVPKVTADYLVFYKGKGMLIECKMSSNKPSYNLGYIKQHQIDAGLQLQSQGVPYYFIINQRHIPENSKPGKANPYEVFIIDARTISTLLAIKKSVKWEDLYHACDHYVPPSERDTKHQTWNLEWLFTEGFDLNHEVPTRPMYPLKTLQKKFRVTKGKKETEE